MVRELIAEIEQHVVEGSLENKQEVLLSFAKNNVQKERKHNANRNVYKRILVKESQTAKMLGSGDLEVLGTPALAAMIEQTAKEAVKDQLSVGETTVGTVLELRHLFPSAVGATIVVTMTSIEQTAHKIRYEFVAYEGERQIAKGSHQRAVVEIDSF